MMNESESTQAIEAILEATRARLEARGYAVAPGITVRQTAGDGAEHFILDVDRAGVGREVHLTLALGGAITSSIVRTRLVAGRRQRVVSRATVIDTGSYNATALVDDLVAELPA